MRRRPLTDHRSIRFAVVLVAAAALLTLHVGCRSSAGLLGNEGSELKTDVVWLIDPPELDTPPPPQRTASLEVENDTSLDGDRLAADLKTYIQDAGYLLVDEDEDPYFQVTVKLRKFGQSQVPDSGTALAQDLGILEDAAVSVSDDAGSGVEGYADRVADADRLETPEDSRFFKTREWVLIADVITVQQLKKPATFTLGGDDEATTSAEFPHGARLLAYARQISLIEAEAVSAIEAKLRSAMQKLLP